VYTSTFAQTVLNLHRKVFEFLHFVKRVKEVAAVQRHVATNGIQYRGTQYAVMGRSFLTIKYVVVRCTTHVLIVPIVDIDDDCSTVQTKMGATTSAIHGRTGTCSACQSVHFQKNYTHRHARREFRSSDPGSIPRLARSPALLQPSQYPVPFVAVSQFPKHGAHASRHKLSCSRQNMPRKFCQVMNEKITH
jgi:hypothetical protein